MPIPVDQYLCPTSYEISLISHPHVCSLPSSWFLVSPPVCAPSYTISLLAFLFSLSSWGPCHLSVPGVFTSHCIQTASPCSISGTLTKGAVPGALADHSYLRSVLLVSLLCMLLLVPLLSIFSAVSCQYSACQGISHIFSLSVLLLDYSLWPDKIRNRAEQLSTDSHTLTAPSSVTWYCSLYLIFLSPCQIPLPFHLKLLSGLLSCMHSIYFISLTIFSVFFPTCVSFNILPLTLLSLYIPQ